jgi:ABC-type branched-subunit amino acid transport system substrate-binding protein
MRRLLYFLLALLFLLPVCGPAPFTCDDPLGCLELPPVSPFVIGVLATLSGVQAPAGTGMMESVQSVVKGYGPKLGHEVDLTWQGTGCIEQSARLSAALLRQTSDLLAVIGPSCPADAVLSIPAFEYARIAIPIPISSADSAFQKLASTIEGGNVSRIDGTLILPRTALQETLENQHDHC